MRSVTKEIFIVLLIAASVQSQPVKGEESGQDQNQEGSASAQAPVQDVETSNSSVKSESMKGNESEQFQNQEEYFQHENSTPTVRSLEAEQDQDRARVGSVTELNKAETDLGDDLPNRGDEAPTTRDRDKVTEPTTKEGNDDGGVEIDGNDVKNVTATAKDSKEIHSDDSMNGDGDYSIDDENMASNEESPVPEVEEILEDEVDETVETADAVNSNHFTSSIIFVIVVAVIVIVVSVIGCCCICAKRKQKKSYEMAMKEREPMLN